MPTSRTSTARTTGLVQAGGGALVLVLAGVVAMVVLDLGPLDVGLAAAGLVTIAALVAVRRRSAGRATRPQ